MQWQDVVLLIEVADTSLRYDRSTKLRLYAATGVPEYWLVDCAAESIEVFCSPGVEGYRDVRRVAGEGTVTVGAFPDVALRIGAVFA
jgi:Uma2 family endonuclease